MKRIKNSAIALLAGLLLVVTPVQLFAQSAIPDCHNGQTVKDEAGVITQVTLQDDDNHYQITIATDYGVFIRLENASLKAAKVAGKLIGEQVTVGGTIQENKNCQLLILSGWHFGN
jgi:hypothetical protein